MDLVEKQQQLAETGGEKTRLQASPRPSPRPSPKPSPRHSRGSDCEERASSPGRDEVQQLIPPSPPDQPKVLCGYLKKETTRSVIKQWRQRWVVFDDQECSLLYYNSKQDSAPQGSIAVSNATFTYNVENLSRNQFEIRTPEHVYNFQAASQDAMFQWMDALQKKRWRFSERKKKESASRILGISPAEAVSAGLVSESNLSSEENREEEELESNGVVIDSDLPMGSPGGHGSAAESSNLHKIMKHLSRVTVKKQNSSPLSTGNRKSTFYASIPEGDAHTQSDTAIIPQSDSDGPRSWRPSMPEWITSKLSRSGTRSGTDVGGGDCPKCAEYRELVDELQGDIAFKDREVKDRSDVIDFLREEIKQAQLKDKVRQELSTNDHDIPENRIDVLAQRDELIQSLQLTLGKLSTENQELEDNLCRTQRECASMKDEISLYMETITAKDQIVVDLTNKLFVLESGGQVLRNPHDAMLPTTTSALEEEISKLKETVEAYKQQNVFLSREMMELHQLRTADVETMSKLKSKLTDQEAEFIRLQSKYFVLLKEAQAPRLEHEVGPDTEMVSQMMQEALDQSYTIMKARSNSELVYDQYGFRQVGGEDSDKEEEGVVQQNVSRTFNQQVRQVDESVASQIARWDNFLVPYNGGKDLSKLVRSIELKNLIRGGVPRRYRGAIWRWCIRLHLNKKCAPNVYQETLKKNMGMTSVAINQIELDLLRTLPTNKYYNSPDAPGIAKLRRVLVAYSWYDSTVGYCQGLNRLAAIALLFLDEEYAFWCLVTIVNYLLPPDYYNQTLLGSQTDQRVLRELITEKMPRLSAHLDTCDIDFSLITFNWFHTIFIDNLPVETMLRIWDTFLYEGSKVLFRYAIAIFKDSEESLLSVENSISIFNKLRTMAQDVSEVQKLTQIAFYDQMMRNFSKKMIQQRRQLHRSQLKFELDKLDKQRSHDQSRRQSHVVADAHESDSDDDTDVLLEDLS